MTAKGPILLPPAARSGPTLGLIRGAARGRFALQRCGGCGSFLYPVRDACPACLSADLGFETAPTGGVLLSETTIRISSDPFFRSRPPVRQGLVRADCGVTMIAILHRDCSPEGRLRLSLKLDRTGQPVAYACPEDGKGPDMDDDPHLRDLTMQPKGRCVLISDAAHPVALPLAAALRAAGASEVLLGAADPGAVAPVEGVTVCPLDLRDDASVGALAAQVASRVDIVAHTPWHPAKGVFTPDALPRADDAIRAGALGLLRLAQALAPAMAARAGMGAAGWVVLHGLDALVGHPATATRGMAGAATLSLAQSLRGEMAGRGLRVVNAFAGVLDIPRFQTLPQPKTAPAAVAAILVRALQDGVEDIHVGPDAEDLRDRMARDPKAAERLARGG